MAWASHVLSSTIAAVQNIPPPEHEGELNYISKYLVQYIPAKKAPPTWQCATTGARVLTSEECAQLIFEWEEKKKSSKKKKKPERLNMSLKREKEKRQQKRKQNKPLRGRKWLPKKEEAAKRKEEIARKKEEAVRKKLEKVTRSTTKQVSHTLTSAAKRRKVDSEEHEVDTDTDPLDDEMQEAFSDDCQLSKFSS